MRIIAGTLGGRQFDTPKGLRAHPMGEKIRGGLFNSLGDLEGMTVLDAFAGSGALSYEAISRGAGHVTAIEVNKSAHSMIVDNSKKLGIDESKVKIIRANATSWSDNNSETRFDIVLLDPPYGDIKPKLLEKIADHAQANGTIVVSLPPRSDFKLPAVSYKLLANKNYGDAQLVFYRRIP